MMTADDQHILEQLNTTIKRYHDHVEKFRFHDMAQIIYDFVWRQFCDWYLEYSKQYLHGEDEEKKQKVLTILHYLLSRSLSLLHPIMPFITEELWNGIGYAESQGMLATGHLFGH